MRAHPPSRRAVHRTLAYLFTTSVVALAALSSRDSEADCNHSCPREQWDAHGCCPAVVKPLPPGKVTCPEGQESTVDTAGRCCWPGQVWANGRCVGVPTACPKRHAIDRAGEQCKLLTCPDGMVRPPNDKTQCCWPGQAWSQSRNTCVGKPKSCPKTHEMSTETCLSLDIDGDGIPNKLDKCPTEPEDFNGYKDDDGCPDEREYQAILAEKRRVEEAAKAKREREEREAREAIERREREAREAEQRRLAAIAAEEAQQRAARRQRFEEAKKKAESNRGTAGGLLTMGLISGAGAGLFLGLGAAQNGKIHDGGFATADDIQSAADKGKTLNILAGVTGAVAGTLTVISIIVYATNREPKEADIAKRVQLYGGPTGLGVRGSF